MRTCKTKLLLTSVVLVWSICTHVFAYESKDPNSIVYGLFAVQGKTTTYDTISRKCFAGLSLTSCVLTNIYEGRGSSVLEATQQMLDVAAVYGSSTYCVGCCCQNNPSGVNEKWALNCRVTPPEAMKANIFGQEARFLKKSTKSDTSYTTCPLLRSDCNYDSSGKVIPPCNFQNSGKFIGSYTLNIELYEKTDGFSYWKNVESCKFNNVLELSSVPSQINETIWMENYDKAWHPASWQLSFLSLIFMAVLTVMVRHCRNDYCQVCDNHLIYFKDLCVVCRLYGCEKPDPVLLQRLKERNEALRGKDFKIFESEEIQWLKENTVKAFQYVKGQSQAIISRLRKKEVGEVQPPCLPEQMYSCQKNVRPSAGGREMEEDVVEIFYPEKQHWVFARVLKSLEVTLVDVPEFVRDFVPELEPPQPLAQTPHEAPHMDCGGEEGKGEAQHRQTRHSASRAETVPSAEEKKEETIDLEAGGLEEAKEGKSYDPSTPVVTLCRNEARFYVHTIQLSGSDSRPEEGNNRFQVYFLVNYGAYGLVLIPLHERVYLWRFSASRIWPKPITSLPREKNEELHFIKIPEHLTLLETSLPVGALEASIRPKSSEKSSSSSNRKLSKRSTKIAVDLEGPT